MGTRRLLGRTLGRLAAAACAALAGIAGTAASESGVASAAQANWSRYSLCLVQDTYISFVRNGGPNGCYTNLAYGSDSDLRTSGWDVYLDGYFLGNLPGTTSNTHAIASEWTVDVRICSGVNYVGLRYLIPSGESRNVSGTIRSYRSSGCV